MKNKFKGTKGEWITERRTFGGVDCIEVNSLDSVYWVCQVSHNDKDIEKANAQLIAAAPELLEALQRSIMLNESLLAFADSVKTEMKASETIDELKQAINKALGQ